MSGVSSIARQGSVLPITHLPATSESKTLVLDMGVHEFKDFPFLREYEPGGTTLQGLQIMQLLSTQFAPRAFFFGALATGQVGLPFKKQEQ